LSKHQLLSAAAFVVVASSHCKDLAIVSRLTKLTYNFDALFPKLSYIQVTGRIGGQGIEIQQCKSTKTVQMESSCDWLSVVVISWLGYC
jgi:hypothetical protein